MTNPRATSYKTISNLPAASAGALTDSIAALQGQDVSKLTLTQISTLMNSTLAAALTASTLSAMTFTVTGATDGAISALTSASNSFGFANLGEAEYTVNTVKTLKAFMDEILAL